MHTNTRIDDVEEPVENKVVEHAYFGTDAVLNDLKQMQDWNDGFICTTEGGTVRDPVTGLVTPVGYRIKRNIKNTDQTNYNECLVRFTTEYTYVLVNISISRCYVDTFSPDIGISSLATSFSTYLPSCCSLSTPSSTKFTSLHVRGRDI